ncbi:hypothetical protein GCM10010211_16860 [Streptomyces albospinus]|uniref:Uncharacterized protein n=1 Tax=Streptomyces albospinus TaxID=285515 RepID=A0ABQ2UXG6_9ACTN|nr:hypothetical protein [Streptomyces albospinus]GGU52918.1 hypothetical protein GCM10010211_16860 [Streptomyces albospinus]
MQVTGGELRLAVRPLPVGLPAIAPAAHDEFTCQARLDDAVGISRWCGRRTPVKPPCHVHRESSSQAPAHETARAPAPTAAAQEQAARIAKSGMKADAFERVV